MSNQVVTVTNVHKTVAGQKLLANVTFSITEQSLISLIGPNGAGKSTLVKIMLGLDNASKGSVVWRTGERVQYIPQLTTVEQYQLPLSVKEYLNIGATPLYRRQSTPIDLSATLDHVGVATSVLDQTYSSLSGGERQRIAIARALLTTPTVLLLDEPLAAVDYASRAGLYKLIRHLQQDHHMTVLLVSHDIDSVIPLSDRVLCLNKTLHTDCQPNDFLTTTRAQAVNHHC